MHPNFLLVFLDFLHTRLVEVHSPDAKHTLVLRSKDSATAQAWFTAIHSCVNDLIPKAISEIRDQLGKTGISGGQEIRHLGWLAEKVRAIFLCYFKHLLCAFV